MPEKNILQRFFSSILGTLDPVEEQELFQLVEKRKEEIVQRSVSMENLVEQLYVALRSKDFGEGEDSSWNYSFYQMMYDDDGFYTVLKNYKNGKLYRSIVDTSGEAISLGDFEEVEESYLPKDVSRGTITVARQKDGRVRLTMIAGTSVLNRDKEIDSTELYDSFVEHAEELDLYPKIDVFHLGKSYPVLDVGQVDFVAREGVVYIASGLLEEDNVFAERIARDLTENYTGIEWGCSIEYHPVSRSVEKIGVTDDLAVAVYRKGINTRITLCEERSAASWFTTVMKGDEEMNSKQREKLLDLLEGDENLFSKVMGTVDDVNRTVEEEGLVSRSDESNLDPEGQVVDENAEENTSEEVNEIEIDDNLVEMIVDRVVEKMGDNSSETLEKVQSTLEEISAKLEGSVERQTGIEERLSSLEVSEEDKKKEWTGDLSDKITRSRVTYRPSVNREVNEDEGEENKTMQAKADATLSNLPVPGKLMG